MPLADRRRRTPPALLAIALALITVSCTPPEAPPPPQTEQPVPPALLIRMATVAPVVLEGRPPRGALMPPAEEVRETLTEMYTAGFLDPAQWHDGFPAVLDAFARETRGQARKDLRDLTLGGAARSLESVAPVHA